MDDIFHYNPSAMEYVIMLSGKIITNNYKTIKVDFRKFRIKVI